MDIAVTSSSTNVVAVDETDARICGGLEKEAGLANVARDDLVDGEAVNIPCLNGVASCTSYVDDLNKMQLSVSREMVRVRVRTSIVTLEFAAWSRSKRMPRPPLRFMVILPSFRPVVP